MGVNFDEVIVEMYMLANVFLQPPDRTRLAFVLHVLLLFCLKVAKTNSRYGISETSK